jgi:hypothetical protein
MKLEALKELAAKVEAGNDYGILGITDAALGEYHGFSNSYLSSLVEHSFDGSLDAAKALHDAVLPSVSQFSITTDPTCIKVTVCGWPDGLSGEREIQGKGFSEGNPARAWLLAILRALIAQEEGK